MSTAPNPPHDGAADQAATTATGTADGAADGATGGAAGAAGAGQEAPLAAHRALLARKISATGGRRGGLPDFAPRALGQAIGRAAQALYDVQATFEEPSATIATRGDLLAGLPDPVLCYLLTPSDGADAELSGGAGGGTGGGAAGGAGPGLVWLDGHLINALIEVMTHAPEDQVYREPRPVTAIDQALCGGFWGPVLGHLPAEFRRLQAAEGGAAGGRGAAGRGVARDTGGAPPVLQPGDAETDPRRLAFLLDEGSYGILSGRIAFQGGLRGGAFGLALPLGLWARPASGPDPALRAAWQAALRARILSAPMTLTAILERLEMPLSRTKSLRPGDLLPLSAGVLSAVELAAVDGTVLLEGRLGQARGRKAVSVCAPPMPRQPGGLPPLPAPAARQEENALLSRISPPAAGAGSAGAAQTPVPASASAAGGMPPEAAALSASDPAPVPDAPVESMPGPAPGAASDPATG